ncbi:MAG: hypothetical protein QNJ65_21810 [Xenococcaceae cyanobacterium MO_234.B1]|nr:hypothetical protein [Xenococcaceae cyanobacterium MO_234.B1]
MLQKTQAFPLIFPTKRVLQSRGNPCDRIFKEAKRDGLTIEEVLEKYFPEDEEESDPAEEDKEEDKNVRSLHSRTSKDQTMVS